MEEIAVKVVGLRKSYGNHQVLRDFSMEVEKGKVNCIMGKSGSGKTTLLRIMMGLERADQGECQGIENLRRSAVFQEDRLCENLSILANIRLVCPEKTREQILREMREVDLNSSEDQLVSELSGGMKRRVAILRALLAPYDILFLDEPFRGLDKETEQKVIAYAKEKCKGRTVIFVTHKEEEAQRMGAVQIIKIKE